MYQHHAVHEISVCYERALIHVHVQKQRPFLQKQTLHVVCFVQKCR